MTSHSRGRRGVKENVTVHTNMGNIWFVLRDEGEVQKSDLWMKIFLYVLTKRHPH